jgi:hypothetical protein
MTYQPNVIHVLRIYHDNLAGGFRLEARPYRGTRRHVPIWTAFITANIREANWARQFSRRVELRKLDQLVFVAGYVPPKTSKGRFMIDFQNVDGMPLCLLVGIFFTDLT